MNIRWNPSKLKISLRPGRKTEEMSLSRKVEMRMQELQKDSGKGRVFGRTMATSPAGDMSTLSCLLGWLARAFVLFSAIYGTALFLCDAARLVELTNKRPTSAVSLEGSFLLILCAALALFFSACAWNRITRILLPIAGLGGGALYILTRASDPVRYVFESLRMTVDLVLENLAEIGYTAYVKYMYGGIYVYADRMEELVKHGTALVLIVFGALFAIALTRHVRPVLTAVLLAAEMVPVFMFNITATNTGFGWLLVTLCGVICLWLYDRRYETIDPAKQAKLDRKAQKKAAAKAEKLAKKEHKKQVKAQARLAYLNVIRDGGKTSWARAAAGRVKKAEKARLKTEKAAAVKAKKTARAEAKKAAAEAKKAKKAARAEAAAKRKALAKDKAAKAGWKADSAARKAVLREEKKKALQEKWQHSREALLAGNKKIAGGGFVGLMAMVVAFAAIWLPYNAIENNFPIIDAINNRMQIARMYVTAYLMGDDVDLNSLSLYGGVSELNPRSISFDTPQFTGQKLFTLDAGYAAPVYMRSWVGTTYDITTDSWTSADSDQVLAYRELLGSSYSPDSISTSFNGYVYPKSLDVQRFDQYRNLDSYGFRVFQVNVRRDAGSSKLLFIPAVMNTDLGIMEYGSIDPIEVKYSAYYDGIYSSRFFNTNVQYSTSSFIPVMKDPEVGANYEKSIQYYNTALEYAELIDTLETSLEQGIWVESEYTLNNGENYMIDSASIVADFEEWAEKELEYRWDGDSLIYRYLGMDSADRKALLNAHEKELTYRDYAMETYTGTFGSEALSELADQILADAGIVMGERPVTEELVYDEEAGLEVTVSKEDISESWFYDAETGGTVPRHEAILAVINYLRDNYTYTLEPSVPMKTEVNEEGETIEVPDLQMASRLESFLFEVEEGYCVHFATSAVGLLRELGFAVRYTEGYIADGFTRTYATDAVARYRTSVRDYDAHAWVEVYYPDMGWIQYETTPSFCEAIYDADVAESTTGSTSSSNQNISSGGMTEEIIEDEEIEEDDPTAKYIMIGVGICILAAMILSAAAWLLRKRAERAIDRRMQLIRLASDREEYLSGRVDVHQTARDIIDNIFAVFRGLGRANVTGELPSEYALRLSEEFGALSALPLPRVMEIIEQEEFGGSLSWQELNTLAVYLEDLTKGAYAGLNWRQKIRMRYLLALL